MQDPRAVVLGDGGDQIVERRDAEMPVCGPALGALGDPKHGQRFRVGGR
jgi:hypothetical protein